MVGGAYGVASARVGIGSFVLLNAYVLQRVRPLEMLGFALRDLGQGFACRGCSICSMSAARTAVLHPSRPPHDREAPRRSSSAMSISATARHPA